MTARGHTPAMPRGLAILLAIMVGVMVATATENNDQDEPRTCPVALPYAGIFGLIVIPVEIGDGPPLNFILDTGTNFSTLAGTGLAHGLGLRFDNTGLARGFGRGAFEVQIATGVSIFGGGGMLVQTDLAVHSVNPDLARAAGYPIHGLLGSTLFEHNVVEVDPSNRTVLLYPPSSFEYLGSGMEIPIRIEDGRPILRAKVANGRGRWIRVNLLVDTGSAGTLTIVTGSHRQLQLPKNARRIQAVGVGGTTDAFSSQLPALEIKDIVVARPPTTFIYPYQLPAVLKLEDLNGVLGMGFLSRFRFFIDYPRSRLILEPLGEREPE